MTKRKTVKFEGSKLQKDLDKASPKFEEARRGSDFIIKGGAGSSGGGGITKSPQDQKREENIQAKKDSGKELTHADLVFLNKQNIMIAKQRAKERNIDISTQARQIGFLQSLKKDPVFVSKKVLQDLRNRALKGNKTAQNILKNQNIVSQDLISYERIRTGTFRGVPTFEWRKKVNGKVQPLTREDEKYIKDNMGSVEKVEGGGGFLERNIQAVNEELAKIQTKKSRGTATLNDNFTEMVLVGIGTANTLTLGIKDLPKTLQAIIQNPSLLKSIPDFLESERADFSNLLNISPSEAVLRVGANLYLLRASGRLLNTLSKSSKTKLARLSTLYKGVSKRGGIITVTTKSGNKLNLKVIGKLPRASLKSQAKQAGKKAVPTSAQADGLVGLIRRKKMIRKPIQGEADLPVAVRNLLSKFDSGKITSKQLITLDKQLKKLKKGGILERSFFADPKGRVRPSRLGKEPKEASLIDILADDVSFRSPKPQILVFDNVKVQKFPKSLANVKKKLKSGKPLTQKEADDLLKFQLKKSGKFKPIGFLSQESEILLAPNEIIKRVKKVGVTVIDGRSVPIIEAKVFKPKGKLLKDIKLAKSGKLNKKQLKSLDKRLKKETGLSYGLSSKKVGSRPRVSLKRFGVNLLTRTRGKGRRKTKGKPIRRFGRGKSTRPRRLTGISKGGGSRTTRTKKITRIVRGGRGGRTGLGTKVARGVTVTKKKSTKIKRKKRAKAVQVFNVYGRVRKKYVKLNSKPLTKTDALSKGAFAVDHSTARTFQIRPVGKKSKKVGGLLKKERGYFDKVKKKLRLVQIKKGKKRPLKKTYIEKRGKPLIDTRGEKKGLGIRRKIVSKTKPKPKKRKMTALQRSIAIKNLALARSIKARRMKPIKTVSRKTAPKRISPTVIPPKTKTKLKVNSTGRGRKRKLTNKQRQVLLKNLKKARAVKKRKKRK